MKIKFDFKHGKVEGVYINAGETNFPLAIITNGHNGFYNYGMFPYIQKKLSENGISSFSYNFSHGGVEGDSDFFSRLDLYEKNSMALETKDLIEIVRHLKEIDVKYTQKNDLVLLSHSLGSVPTIFGAKQLIREGFNILGIVLIAPTMTLNFWSKDEMEEWEKNGRLLLKNKRTNQELPQGKEFLEETKKAETEWSIQEALKEVPTSFLIIHGEKDEAIPVEESETINRWNAEYDNKSNLIIVPNATHTFNTKHPFLEPSVELDVMISKTIQWIKNDN